MIHFALKYCGMVKMIWCNLGSLRQTITIPTTKSLQRVCILTDVVKIPKVFLPHSFVLTMQAYIFLSRLHLIRFILVS